MLVGYSLNKISANCNLKHLCGLLANHKLCTWEVMLLNLPNLPFIDKYKHARRPNVPHSILLADHKAYI